ncbi:metal-dependent hydrolase [Candidatus Woesearchaeota archaeon]|nr:metal-dependent hydrolase [Candidatus Woesearchaeota archaeon]
MALPAAHIIFPMLIVETYRRYFAKPKFSFLYTFLAGFAGAFPDVDILAGMLVTWLTGQGTNFHRSITHSLVLPMFIFILCIICVVLSKYMKKYAWKNAWKRRFLGAAFFQGAAFLLLISGFGILSHSSLDCLAWNDALLLPFKRVQVCSGILVGATNAGIFDGLLVLSWFVIYGGVIAEIRQWRKRSAQKIMQSPTRPLKNVQKGKTQKEKEFVG